MASKEKALICARAALDKKAEDLQILDVRTISSFSDYFIIGSGHSTRHVQGIVQAIEESLRPHKIYPKGVEGLGPGQWVLMDYNDVVIHVFHTPIRGFYDLESLWSEAKIVELNPVK
jgi:ribosome-associated protein